MEARRRAALALSCLFAALAHPLRVPVAVKEPQRLWPSSHEALARILRLSPRDRAVLASFRREYSHDATAARLRESGLSMIVPGEPGFPQRLAATHDPPVALFIAGKPARLKEFMDHPRIAIVGSRQATAYGYDAARFLAAGLARNAVCVVSGMALGIDAAAHDAVLAAGGDTIAVLGCGPDIAYPAANRRLYGELLKNGLVLSEYPPGTPPRPWRFPARNRIIAGLADGVIVVEAAARSGALITADFCLEQGGEVFAVPGSIFSPASAGTNRLIQDGACVATTVEDVITAIGCEVDAVRGVTAPAGAPGGCGQEAARVLAMLGPLPQSVDVIARKCAMAVPETLTALTALELGGAIRFEPGRGYYL